MGKTTGVYFCKERDFWYNMKGKQQCIVLVDIYTSVYQRRKGFVVVNSPWFPGEVKYWTLAEKSSIICRNRSPLCESNYKIRKNGTFDIDNEMNRRCLYGCVHAQSTVTFRICKCHTLFIKACHMLPTTKFSTWTCEGGLYFKWLHLSPRHSG